VPHFEQNSVPDLLTFPQVGQADLDFVVTGFFTVLPPTTPRNYLKIHTVTTPTASQSRVQTRTRIVAGFMYGTELPRRFNEALRLPHATLEQLRMCLSAMKLTQLNLKASVNPPRNYYDITPQRECQEDSENFPNIQQIFAKWPDRP
jgi:hypothetical protein